MDLLEKTKEICKFYDIKPARSKGQNFLINESVYDQIVAAADLKKDDFVLEVGPGLGFLTLRLAQKAGQVVAVELDDKLAAYLKKTIDKQEIKNIEIINSNILDLDIEKLFSNFKFSLGSSSEQGQISNFKIAANLPYNITSVFLRKFLSENKIKPEMMVLLLQKEVAERICARPGDMSLLALSVQFYAEPEIIGYVSRRDFFPAPEVDSAIIQLKIKSASRRNELPINNHFWRLAKIGFSAKRKMLKNNLANGLHITGAEAEKILLSAGLDLKIRAEDLSLEDWGRIVNFVS